MFCTNCGAQLPDDSQFCTECGQPLTPASTPQPDPSVADATRVMPSTAPVSSQEKHFCTNCGAEIPEGCAFCISCGAPADGSMSQPGLDSTAQNYAIPSEALDNNYQAPQKSSSKGPVIAAVIVLVIVLGLGSVVGLNYFGVLGDQPFLRFLPKQEQAKEDSSDEEEEEKAEEESSKDKKDDDEDSDSERKSSEDEDDDEDRKSNEDKDDESDDKSSSNSNSSSNNSGNASSGTNESSDFILPDSSTRTYSTSELSDLTDWELYIARNEIYARHGRGFSNQDLRDYFSQQSWYTELYTPEYFDSNISLNSVEQQNVETILALEQSRGSQYI